jgi:hypothetical protein
VGRENPSAGDESIDRRVLEVALSAFQKRAAQEGDRKLWSAGPARNTELRSEAIQREFFDRSSESIGAWKQIRGQIDRCLLEVVGQSQDGRELFPRGAAGDWLIPATAPESKCDQLNAERQAQCAGWVEYWRPGYCGPRREWALVVFDVFPYVENEFLRSSHNLSVVLKFRDNDWFVTTVWAFGGDFQYQ